MEKNDKNLNITINNGKENNNVIISFSVIAKMTKKFFALWLAIAVIAGFVSVGIGTARTFLFKEPLTALVSFTYSGIEKGLTPNGKSFDSYDIVNPTVLQRALSDNDLELDKLESVRKSISIEGMIPEDTMDRITAYKNVYENSSSGNLAAAEAMLNVTYNPTQFKITFKYGNTSLNRSDSVKLLNSILEDYRDYFYEIYGFNQSLGTAISGIDYTTYDYDEQLDVFEDSLSSIERYVRNLSNEDTNLFRSSETGLTFNDLYRSAQTIRSIDFDRISSYIILNCITKDRAHSIAYYNYKIDGLKRKTITYTDELATIEDAISKYTKDTVLIFGNGTDGTDTTYSQASEEYDRLIQQRISVSADLAETKQIIKYYEARRDNLQNNKEGAPELAKNVDEQLLALNEKILELVELTEKTSNEYFKTVQYKNAYNVLIPAAGSVSASINEIISNSLLPCIFIEALIIFIFILIIFAKSVLYCSEGNTQVSEKAAPEDDNSKAAEAKDEKSDDKNSKKK